MVGVAQSVRAPGCGPGGRGFESLHSPHYFLGVSPSGKAQDFDFCIRWFKSSYPCQEICGSRQDRPMIRQISVLIFNVGVSPSGKATDSDSVIREFKSLHPSHHPLAQPVEHLTFNQGVPSSNLGWMTTLIIHRDTRKWLSW